MKDAGAGRLCGQNGVSDETLLGAPVRGDRLRLPGITEYLLVRSDIPLAMTPPLPKPVKKTPPAFRFRAPDSESHGADSDRTFPLRPAPMDQATRRLAFPTPGRSGKLLMPLSGWPRVEGDYAWIREARRERGLYEIPVGPVHAGIMEPGHFRFRRWGRIFSIWRSVWGIPTRDREALREHADSPKATAWPGACPATARSPTPGPTRRRSRPSPARRYPRARHGCARWLLEGERIANHLGDLGYLGNDAGFAFGLAQFSRLKEDVLRYQSRRVRPPTADGSPSCQGAWPGRPGRPSTPAADARVSVRWSPARCASCATSMTSTRACRTAFAIAGASRPCLPRKLGLTGLAPRPSLAMRLPGCAPYDALACAQGRGRGERRRRGAGGDTFRRARGIAAA